MPNFRCWSALAKVSDTAFNIGQMQKRGLGFELHSC